MEALPNELLWAIVERLSTADRQAVAETSTRIRRACLHLVLTDIDLPSPEFNITRAPSKRRNDYDYINDREFDVDKLPKGWQIARMHGDMVRTAKLTNLILFHPVMQRTLRSFSHLRHLEFDFCGSPIQNTNFRLLFTALQLKHLTSLKVDLTRQSSDWYSSRYCSLVHRGRYKRSREPYFVSFDERRTMIEHIQSEAGRGEVCQLKQLDVRVKILDMSYGGMRCGDDRYSDVRMMMEFLQPAVKDLEELKLAIYAQVFHRDTAPPVWDRETPMWELPKLKTLQVDWDQWGKFGKWLIDWNKDAVIIDNYAEDV